MSYSPAVGPSGRRQRRSNAKRASAGKPDSKKRSVKGIIGLTILIVVGFAASGLVGAGTYFLPSIRTALQITNKQATRKPGTGFSTVEATAQANVPPPNAPFTVLLLGSDNDNKFTNSNYLTQAMILVRVNPLTDSVTMFSIARDLNVPLYGANDNYLNRTDKIDKAYLLGGVQGSINTVQHDFDVQVNYYVWIGLKGLVSLIDQMGKLDIVVGNPVLDDFYPNDLGTGDPYNLLVVGLLPGPQELNGTYAMEYVRSRHDDIREDLGRSVRQQQVLISMKNKSNELNLADIPALTTALTGQVSTNMSVSLMVSLRSVAHKVNLQNIQQVVLFPPYAEPAVVGTQDVLQPNWPDILTLVHQYFPSYTPS